MKVGMKEKAVGLAFIPALVAAFALKYLRDEYSLWTAFTAYYFMWWIPMLVAALIEGRGVMKFLYGLGWKLVLFLLLLSPIISAGVPTCVLIPMLVIDGDGGKGTTTFASTFLVAFSGAIPVLLFVAGMLMFISGRCR